MKEVVPVATYLVTCFGFRKFAASQSPSQLAPGIVCSIFAKMKCCIFIYLSFHAIAFASPLKDTRESPAEDCEVYEVIMDAIYSQGSAPAFCSSFLNGGTSTVTKIVTATSTKATGSASVAYKFLPGNPPPSKRDITEEASTTTAAPSASSTAPLVTSQFPTEAVSSACSCLSITASLVTFTATTTKTSDVQAAAYTSTVYPCPDPLPSPNAAFGDSSSPSDLGLQNNIYYLNTTQGASLSGCCNTCYFEIENCVQAYWYSYQGCVVSRATNLDSVTGQHITANCPAGLFQGLEYGPDDKPAPRSTGNIAGPCGQVYDNLKYV